MKRRPNRHAHTFSKKAGMLGSTAGCHQRCDLERCVRTVPRNRVFFVTKASRFATNVPVTTTEGCGRYNLGGCRRLHGRLLVQPHATTRCRSRRGAGFGDVPDISSGRGSGYLLSDLGGSPTRRGMGWGRGPGMVPKAMAWHESCGSERVEKKRERDASVQEKLKSAWHAVLVRCPTKADDGVGIWAGIALCWQARGRRKRLGWESAYAVCRCSRRVPNKLVGSCV